MPGACQSMYYVYILRSKVDDNFYVGFAENLKRRLTEHSNGAVKSTKRRRPLVLLCYEAYATKRDALRRERYLKSSDGRKELRIRLDTVLAG
ncbi:GIY-YIG nuclease family protein [Patescibacteria group bacterium]